MSTTGSGHENDAEESQSAPAGRLEVLRTYPSDSSLSVLVHFDGEWRRARLRRWSTDDDGTWWGTVSWSDDQGSSGVGTFHENRITIDLGGLSSLGAPEEGSSPDA